MKEYNWTSEDSLRLITWAKNLKPGDVFGACSAFNHRVKEVKVKTFKYDDDQPEILQVEIEDTTGNLHNIERASSTHWGCICFPYTIEEIKDFFLNELDYQGYVERGWDPEGKTKKLIDDIRSGNYPFDEDGVRK